MPNLIPRLNIRRSSNSTKTKLPLTIDTLDQSSTSQSSSSNSLIVTSTDKHALMPIVKSPGWEIRYDTTLCVYYYLNAITNETQFDHPDEVAVSPLTSPVSPIYKGCTDSGNDHRKLSKTGSTSTLKRTLSPKFLGSALRRRSSSSSKWEAPRTTDNINEIINNADMNTDMNEDNEEEDDDNNDNEKLLCEDQDIKEFRKQLDLEIQNYETERLNG